MATALAIRACQENYRVAFATAQQWIDRLESAQNSNSLDQELKRRRRYGLLVIDEIGYLPLERQAANLLFALIARRYERGSVIVTSNRGFEAWGEILGDQMVAAALIWRNRHGGMKADDAKRLKQLEKENQQLKRIVADKELNIAALEGGAGKILSPARRREAVDHVVDCLGISERRACRYLGQNRFEARKAQARNRPRTSAPGLARGLLKEATPLRLQAGPRDCRKERLQGKPQTVQALARGRAEGKPQSEEEEESARRL